MEMKVNSNYAIFWVKVNDTLESNATIYVYYGKADATTTSSITNTFLVADDFTRANSGTVGGGWTEQEDSGVGAASILTNRLKIYQNQNYYTNVYQSASATLNQAIVTKADATGGSVSWAQGLVIYWDKSHWVKFYINLASDRIQANYRAGGAEVEIAHTGWTDGVTMWFMARIDGTSVYCDYSADGITWTNFGSVTLVTLGEAGVNPSVYILGKGCSVTGYDTYNYFANNYSTAGTAETGYYYYFYARKYILAEPAHSTWGSETQSSYNYTATINLSTTISINSVSSKIVKFEGSQITIVTYETGKIKSVFVSDSELFGVSINSELSKQIEVLNGLTVIVYEESIKHKTTYAIMQDVITTVISTDSLKNLNLENSIIIIQLDQYGKIKNCYIGNSEVLAPSVDLAYRKDVTSTQTLLVSVQDLDGNFKQLQLNPDELAQLIASGAVVTNIFSSVTNTVTPSVLGDFSIMLSTFFAEISSTLSITPLVICSELLTEIETFAMQYVFLIIGIAGIAFAIIYEKKHTTSKTTM
jgi:hypothetical protein